MGPLAALGYIPQETKEQIMGYNTALGIRRGRNSASLAFKSQSLPAYPGGNAAYSETRFAVCEAGRVAG